jgi:hypothetical protein
LARMDHQATSIITLGHIEVSEFKPWVCKRKKPEPSTNPLLMIYPSDSTCSCGPIRFSGWISTMDDILRQKTCYWKCNWASRRTLPMASWTHVCVSGCSYKIVAWKCKREVITFLLLLWRRPNDSRSKILVSWSTGPTPNYYSADWNFVSFVCSGHLG